MPDTETIDRLFLELSQFTKATTARESDMANQIHALCRLVSEAEGWIKNDVEYWAAMGRQETDSSFINRKLWLEKAGANRSRRALTPEQPDGGG